LPAPSLARLSPGALVKLVCPHCGSGRVGAFRFCRDCQFDFDELEAQGRDSGSNATDTFDVGGHSVGTTAVGLGSVARGLLGVAFILAVGISGLSSIAQPDARTPTTAARSTAIATIATPPDVEEGVAGTTFGHPNPRLVGGGIAAGPTGKVTTASVVRVLDAITIIVAVGGRQSEVRYAGLSSPASVDRQATAANRSLVAGKTVVLEMDGSTTDQAGRLLRQVWVHRGSTWTLVNYELIRRGFAKMTTRSPDKRYADAYLAAERQARARRLGLWHTPADSKPEPQASSRPPKPSKSPGGRPDADASSRHEP
jgi:endonuclease YncB( thermonuclease family)